jgi:hypothetical protein
MGEDDWVAGFDDAGCACWFALGDRSMTVLGLFALWISNSGWAALGTFADPYLQRYVRHTNQ